MKFKILLAAVTLAVVYLFGPTAFVNAEALYLRTFYDSDSYDQNEYRRHTWLEAPGVIYPAVPLWASDIPGIQELAVSG